MNDSDNFWRTATDMVRALHGCPRTEKVTNLIIDGAAPLGQGLGTQHQVTPPANATQNPLPTSIPSLPFKLIQGCIATGAAIGVVIAAGLNFNFLASAFVGGVGAGLGSVAASVNKKDPKEEAKKLLSQVGDRYAANADLEKLTTVKEILGYLEGR